MVKSHGGNMISFVNFKVRDPDVWIYARSFNND